MDIKLNNSDRGFCTINYAKTGCLFIIYLKNICYVCLPCELDANLMDSQVPR